MTDRKQERKSKPLGLRARLFFFTLWISGWIAVFFATGKLGEIADRSGAIDDGQYPLVWGSMFLIFGVLQQDLIRRYLRLDPGRRWLAFTLIGAIAGHVLYEFLIAAISRPSAFWRWSEPPLAAADAFFYDDNHGLRLAFLYIVMAFSQYFALSRALALRGLWLLATLLGVILVAPLSLLFPFIPLQGLALERIAVFTARRSLDRSGSVTADGKVKR